MICLLNKFESKYFRLGESGLHFFFHINYYSYENSILKNSVFHNKQCFSEKLILKRVSDVPSCPASAPYCNNRARQAVQLRFGVLHRSSTCHPPKVESPSSHETYRAEKKIVLFFYLLFPIRPADVKKCTRTKGRLRSS